MQLTWAENYKTMSSLLGIDLLNNPDLALDPAVAAKIMFEGMIRGTFTGKSLATYFSDHVSDWRNARKIINALDHADEIAAVAKQFFAALQAAGETTGPPKTVPLPTLPRSRSWIDVLLSPFRKAS